jgi:hypothetical protein
MENQELESGIGQKIGYRYGVLNNPDKLNGDVRLNVDYIEGIEVPFIFVEAKEGDQWVRVTKLLKNYSGVSEDIKKQFQNQFDNIVAFIKKSGPVLTKVVRKDSYTINTNKGVQTGLEQLLTNERAKSNLPDGEIYIGTIQNGLAKTRDINNDGQGGSVAEGNTIEGRHFVVIKTGDGTLIPVYLQDSTLNEIVIDDKSMLDVAIEQIESIKNEFLQSELPKNQRELNKFWNKKSKELVKPIVNINRQGNNPFGIDLKIKNGVVTAELVQDKTLPESEVYKLLGNRFYNIEVEKLISDPKYSQFLIKNRILTTDLNTERPVINTRLQVDVSFLQHPERLRATGESTLSNFNSIDVKNAIRNGVEVKLVLVDGSFTFARAESIGQTSILTKDGEVDYNIIKQVIALQTITEYGTGKLKATKDEVLYDLKEKSVKPNDSDLEELRKLEEELNPTVDPTKVNDAKTKLVESRDYKQINLEEETQWIKTNLPQIPVEVVKTTLDIAKKFGKEAHGVFSNAMIYIAENGATGTAYHEAYHAVETLYLTPEQVSKLNATGTTEEQRAKMFEDYVQSEQNISPTIRPILDFFRDIYYWIKDLVGLTSTKDIFYKINTGKFANSPVKNSKFKAENKYKLIDPDNINPLEQKQRIESLLYEVFNGLRAAQNKGSIISLDVDALNVKTYNEVWDKIKRMWELREKVSPHTNRKNVLDNWDEFKELTTKELKRFGIKAVERVEDEKVIDDTKERIYDIAFFKSSIKDTLSTEMKLFVATVPQIKSFVDGKFEFDRDELGNIKFVDRHEIYGNLSKELSNTLSIEEMIAKLDRLGKADPTYYYISDFLKRTTSIVEAEGVTSNNFRNKFYNTFRNNYIKFLTVKKGAREIEGEVPGESETIITYSVFETNKRSLDKQILNKWKSLNSKVEKTKVYTPFKEMVTKNAAQLNDKNNTDSLKLVQKALNDIGIDISFEALVLHKNDYFAFKKKQPYTQYLLEKNKATIGQILNAFSEGKEIFGGGDNVGERNALKLLTKYESQVTSDSTNGAFLNGENELIYPINSPTYASNRIYELKTTDLAQNLLGIPYYKNSRIVAELTNPNSNFRSEFDIYTFDTINDNSKKRQSAIPYSESQDFEFVVSKINTFWNNGNSKYGFFFPPTPSDRGNVSPVKLPKLNLKDESIFINDNLNTDTDFYRWLEGSVRDEFDRIKHTWDTIDSIPETQKILHYHYKVDKEGKVIPNVRGNAFYFNMFSHPELIKVGKDLNNLIYDDIANPELTIQSFDELDQKQVYSILNDIFSTLFNNEKFKMSEKGVLTFNGGKYSFSKGIVDNSIKNKDEFLDQYIVNQFYANVELSRLFSGDIAFYKGGSLNSKDRKTQFADYDKRFGQSFVPGREMGYSKEYSDVVKQNLRIEVASDVKLANETLKKISSKYLENNQTDAQGFTTLERLREQHIGQGTYTTKVKKAWERIKKGGTDAKDISTVFQPVKGFYYSQDIDNRYGIMIPTQVKYSTIPLIPAMYESYPELKEIADRMQDNSIDEFVFESGIKVGRTQESILELQNKNWRIPQVVPYKDTTEERFGSQKRKLITENIDESDTFEGKNLKEYYQELISKNIEEDFKLVAPELKNIDKVAKTLLQQLVENNSKGLPDKFEKAMEVIDTKYGPDTRMSLDHPLIKKRVESIFNSFIDSRVVDQKLPGLSAVQVSTFGQVQTVEDLKFVRLEKDKVKAAEVRMTPKYFLKIMKKQGIKVDDFLTNGKLDITKIPTELRRGTLHRIPTQGKNSMLPFEIVDFNINELGSTIFLPVEVTTQAGSDFDIDKVFIELYNFNVEEGELKKIKGDDTKEGRQNKIIDIHYRILTNSKYFEELITPNNTDTLIEIKNEVLKFESERNKNANLPEFWFSPWLQEEFKARNQAGKQLVGFYSIASVSHAVAQDIKLRMTTGNTINFEGKELGLENQKGLYRIKDIDGNRISDNIAEVQTAAVDNAKDPILGYLNDNLFTAPVKALLLRAGVPLRQTNYFATQPIIIDLTKAFFRNSPSMNDDKALEVAVVDVLKKYNISKLIKDGKPANFTLKTLEDGLRGKGDQKAILEAFLTYKKLGTELYSVSLGLSSDRKGTASTMSENLYNQSKIYEAKNNPYITFDKSLYNKHSLSAFEKYGINDAVELAKQYFSDATEVFKTVHNRLAHIKKEALTVKELQDITYQFYTYLHTSKDALKISNEEKLALLKGNNSLANQIRKFKGDNMFLEQLNIIPDEETGFEMLDFNATANPALSAEEKQLFEDSILDLYRTQSTRQLAIDLLKYCFSTNGFNRGVNSFIDFIPMEMFEDLQLNNYYRDIKQNFNSVEEDLFNTDRFVDQYIQNNFNNLYWIPQYTKKSIKERLEKEDPQYYYNKTGKKLFKKVNIGVYNQLNKLGKENVLREYDIDSDLSSIIPTNNRINSKNQLESEKDQISEKELIQTLEKLSGRFGITYSIDNSLPVLGRYKDGKVYINPKLAKLDTPFHEFSHPFVEGIKKNNPVLYKNLSKQISTTAEGKQILNKVRKLYPELSFEDQIEEAIVTAIGQYASKSISDKGLVETIRILLKRIASMIREIVLGNADVVPDDLNPNMTLQDLGKMVAGEEKIIITNDIDSSKDQRDINKAEKIVSDAINILHKKIKIYEKKGSKGFLDRETKIKADLEKKLRTKQFDQAIIAFVTNVRKEIDLATERINSITEATPNREKAEILKTAHGYIQSYKNIMEEISDETSNVEGLESVVNGINNDINKINRKYYKEIFTVFKDFISPFVSNNKVDIEKELLNPRKDISFTERWLDSVSEASDNAIKWIDKAVKTSKEKARLRALDNQKTLIEAKKALEDAGIKDTKFMYETINGNLTGNLVSEYNQEKFRSERNAMYSSIKELTEKEQKAIKKKWYRENMVVVADEWFPADRYRNKQYSEIQSNPAMKKFYDIIWDMKKFSDSKLPLNIQKSIEFLAPQIRKDIIERIKDTEEGKVGEIINSLKENFVRVEDETEFGITDESGKPINFIPTYFVSRLDKMSDLSTDIVATLSSYNYMSEDFNEMNKIIHQLEIGKDIIEDRDIDTGKIDPITGRSITKPGNASNTYSRLQDYYNMVIYGQMKLDEGTFGDSKIDKAKTLDTFGRYISINSLALNVFSGISNLTQGTAMGRIEGFAKEYFDHKDLLFADETYRKGLPSLLGNIGQRLQSSKLQLWNEMFNVSQDFDEKTRDIDSNRKTVFSRLFKTSSLFFISKAGEHYMQMRTSLALANKTVLTHKDGTKVNLWDAMEVRDNRLVVKEGFGVSEDDLIKFTLKQNGINKRLHGVYNNIDKSAIQKYALGRMAVMFRKWIKPGLNKRFEKLKYNEELEMNTEGYYYTAWRFLGQLKKDIVAGQFSLQKNWKNLSETGKRNMFRVLAEAGYMVAAATLAGILTQLSDDDEENWILAMSAYQANRMYTELRFYSSAKEAFTILKSPAAGINAAQNLVDFIWVPEWFDEVESGKYRGMYKVERNAVKVVPLYNTIRKIGDPEEELIYYKK